MTRIDFTTRAHAIQFIGERGYFRELILKGEHLKFPNSDKLINLDNILFSGICVVQSEPEPEVIMLVSYLGSQRGFIVLKSNDFDLLYQVEPNICIALWGKTIES